MVETWLFVAHPDEGSRSHFRNVVLDKDSKTLSNVPPPPPNSSRICRRHHTERELLNRAQVLSAGTSHFYQLSNSELSVDLCTFSRFGT
jgi:hypothetical protein